MFSEAKVAQMAAFLLAQQPGNSMPFIKLIKLLYLTDKSGYDTLGYSISGDHPVSFIGVERHGVRFKNHSFSVGDEGEFNLIVPLTLDFSTTDTDSIIVEGLLLMGRNPHDPSYVVHVNANDPK